MSTVDGARGIVTIRYPSCFADEVGTLLEALQEETSLRPYDLRAAGENHARPH